MRELGGDLFDKLPLNNGHLAALASTIKGVVPSVMPPSTSMGRSLISLILLALLSSQR
jgi:hypothetical protein